MVMSNPGGPLPLELFRARLMREVKADLSREKDDRLALRKALLSLIMMTQDGAGPIGKQFIEYLIQEFPPLAGHFSATHDHPIFGEHKVGRRYSKDQGLVLSIAKKIAEFMFKEPINAREIALLGEFIPWEMTAERYVGFYDIMG